MYHDHRSVDSYQNFVLSPGANESVETVSAAEGEGAEGADAGVAARYAADRSCDDDEQAERIADDLSSRRAEGGSRHRAGRGNGDRDEPGRGRAASGEPFEDEADNALLPRKRR